MSLGLCGPAHDDPAYTTVRRQRTGLLSVAAAVPKYVATNAGWPEAEAAAGLTGVRSRRWAYPGAVTTDDLCLRAAEQALRLAHADPHHVAVLVYVTQTPGADIPSAAHNLHRELGLPASCPALQVNLACSGYVYGLWLASVLTDRLGGGLGLVLAGDTLAGRVQHTDRSVGPLFGDAGTATVVSASEARVPGCVAPYVMLTDGRGNSALEAHRGGDLTMDGSNVMAFALRTVPRVVTSLLSDAETFRDAAPQKFYMHQANRFVLQQLDRKLGLSDRFGAGAVPCNIEGWGNTSSASIPLLLAEEYVRGDLAARGCLVGFGAGWSVAGTVLNMGHLMGAAVEVLP